MTENEAIQRAFDPDNITYDLENINQLKAMIKKAKEENIDNDSEGINLIKQSEKMLENMLKTYNVLAVNEKTKVPVKALVKLDTAPGTDTPANFLQAQLGLVNNVVNNIRAYKDVAWYFGDEKPADGATPVTVTGKTKTNYIETGSK